VQLEAETPVTHNRNNQEGESASRSLSGCVLTIGNFDGVHRGHQQLLQAARRQAEAARGPVVAVTFDPPPDRVLRPEDVPERIVPADQKEYLLRRAGADQVVTLRADRALLAMTPEEFIDRIIVEKFAPAHVVEGPNFFFGKKRGGNVEILAEAGRRKGFEVHIIEPLRLELAGDSVRVSSTLIRRLLAEGKVEPAAECLGREFTLYGRVVGGFRRGRLLSYPTVNLDCGEQITPADGIYAGWATIVDGRRPAAISLGNNPTFGPTERTIEAFLLNAEGDFYDESMALGFVRRLRDQKRFADGEALKAQISRDVERVQEICQ